MAYTTYKNRDDWGMVYGILLTTLYSPIFPNSNKQSKTI